jgi:uncharacterized protein (DUF1501 family)
MLTVLSGNGRPDCEGVSRRDFLRIGTLGIGGLSMSGLLAAKAHAGASDADFVRDKAVVVLYLSGGASHIETFNPNMDAPAPYHSLTGEVKTTLLGVRFGGTYPRLAQHADKMAIVRSFKHPIGGHSQAHVHMLTGGTDPRGQGDQGYSMGSLYARLRGGSNPATGLPTYSLLTHTEIDGQYSKELGRVLAGSAPGKLGAAYAPFRYNEGGSNSSKKSRKKKSSKKGNSSIAEDMKLNIASNRLDDRRGLLRSLDRMKSDIDTAGNMDAMDEYQMQAYGLILGSAGQAFDVSSEPKHLVERYDTSKTKIGHKKFRPSNLGRQMLVARRLVEAGCGFVTVHSAGWDMHADSNNPGMVKGMNMLGNSMDKAVSAFIEDLQSRGLSEKVLLVITGDFGRTPKINARGGRDHWANLCTLAFAGGGLKMGQVIGQSDRMNAEPASEPISPQMMMTTIMHTLFDPGKLRVAQGLPRELVALVDQGKPIEELF